MSQQLISRSPDLKRLRDEGYDIEIRSKFLLLKNVPYVNSRKEIELGTIVSELTIANNIAAKPQNHVAYFIGNCPCNKDGSQIIQRNQSMDQKLDEGLIVNHMFSSKPISGKYENYYDKMTTYVAIFSNPAQSINPNVTARNFSVIKTSEEESVFKYWDTSSSRAGIAAVTRKLEIGKVAIVGLGGTGSYVLDFIAKTPIKEIHLFDSDEFLNHNAFRSPGAASADELEKKLKKVTYFAELYSKMHRKIIPHECYITESTVDQLQHMNFVFVCLDSAEHKRIIVERLELSSIPFIDVGMGVQLVDDSLLGILRVTTSTVKKREHVRGKNRILFSDGDPLNEYSQNIQIAELNALNAALAVIRWKKICGFYKDLEKEHFTTYTIDGNSLINEDQDET